MGIDHVWLLPVFDHNESGVYHSNDQSVIDQRYGGEDGCKYYCDKAHELGMTILFDYVPHGPAPEFPLAKDNPDWPSKRRDSSLQEEAAMRPVGNPASLAYQSKWDGRVLVLINLSAEPQSFDFGAMQAELLAKGLPGKSLSLEEIPAYAYKLFRLM